MTIYLAFDSQMPMCESAFLDFMGKMELYVAC